MLITTGRKEKLSVSKGSEIEVSSDEFANHTGCVWYCAILEEDLWYCAILEEDLANSKKQKLSVRYLDPILKQDYSPPLTKTTVRRLIRPVPPPDSFPDVGFEEGDVIDAVYDGGWAAGSVVKVLENGHYLVYLRFKTGAIEFERKDMRPHMVWEDNEWFQCEKQMNQLHKPVLSYGGSVEVMTEVDNLGDVWTPAMVINENEDGTILVKLKSMSNKEDLSTKISLPYSEIRPSQPSILYGVYKLMEKVDALLNHRWCPGVVSQVLSGCPEEYVVDLGPNKESKKFVYYHLRPSLQWKDGIWVPEEKAPEETTIREIVNKRKRGRPCVAANGSKAATIEPANMNDDNRTLTSSGKSVSRSPDLMLNSVVEKHMHIDVVETQPAKESTMVLPFAKKSPVWKLVESMDVFKSMPQHPHFSPLLENKEESREGDAIGKMVMYNDLIEKLNNLQVDHPISSINRIDECLIELEKHGFNVANPRSRIAKLLPIKERQTKALEEFKALEDKITKSDDKRRKCEEDIVELQRVKVRLDTEIDQMHSCAAVLDQKVQNVDQDFRAIVASPW